MIFAVLENYAWAVCPLQAFFVVAVLKLELTNYTFFKFQIFFRASFGFLGLVDTVRGRKARLRSVSLICLKRSLIHFDFLCKIH